MITNIKQTSSHIEFDFQGHSYRVMTVGLDFRVQRKLMTLIAPCSEESGEINVLHDSFGDASMKILSHALIKQGDEFKILNEENQLSIFDKEFGKSLGGGWAEVISHTNLVTLFVYQLLLDDEWRPDAVEESEKKPSATNTNSGNQEEEAKATLKTMHS